MKEIIKNLADQDTAEKRELLSQVAGRLRKELSPRCRLFTDYADRKTYSHDMASIPPLLEKMLFRTTPLVVIQPGTADDLMKILAIAIEFSLPVFPRGIASWGLGGAVPTINGMVVDFSPMDGILSIDREEKTDTVEAGLGWGVIDEKLREEGFSLAVTPSSRFSTVGGWIATGGFGLGSLGHGHLKNWVTGIMLATPGKGLVALTPADRDFLLFFNTEGQLGLIYRVTLRFLPLHQKEYIHLVSFRDDGEAFTYAKKMLDTRTLPVTMNFKGTRHMAELNCIWKEKLFTEAPTLLFAFTEKSTEEAYREAFSGIKEEPAHLARLLWKERYNPLKMHTEAPSLLASEVILPLAAAQEFIRKAKRLQKNYGVVIYFEFHFIRDEDGEPRVLAMCLFNCDRRKMIAYYAYLSLVSVLTRLGIRLGGKPYGIGIWNVPFFAHAFSREEMAHIVQGKKKYDPPGIMNPRKFTAIHSRFHDIPAALFHPLIFTLTIDLVTAFSPLLRPLLPVIKELPGGKKGLLEESAFSCTSCGNCLTVCPAYRVTRKESSSPRGKLSLARRHLHGKELSPEAVQEAFYCTRCRNCESVCQSRIKHVVAWEDLEERLRKMGLHDDRKTREFIDSLPQHREYLDLIGIEKWVNL